MGDAGVLFQFIKHDLALFGPLKVLHLLEGFKKWQALLGQHREESIETCYSLYEVLTSFIIFDRAISHGASIFSKFISIHHYDIIKLRNLPKVTLKGHLLGLSFT